MSASTYVPQGDAEFLSPFGPCMGYMRMGEDFVKELNDCMDNKLEDFSEQLVGKVKEELVLDRTNYNYGLQIEQGWFVRQYENEYNPLHVHTGSKLSCVGYLSLPDGIEEEWDNERKKHHTCNGHIQFASGTNSGYNLTTFLARPTVGDFYLFPSELFHTVYPFYTKGERRSFSMNMNCIKIKKSIDK